MSDNPFIQETSEADFHEIVIAASHRLPVLVDFWADWCQPCKILMPLLTKLAEEYDGKFLLAKVNSDDNKQLAGQLGIRSLPTVLLFMDGEAVDSFMGALPETQIREFLDKHIPSEIDALVIRAEELIGAGEIDQGLTLLKQAEELDPENSKVKVTQAKFAMASGETKRAREILLGLDPTTRNEPEIVALISRLELDARLDDAPTADELQQRLDADENDSEARYLLALRLLEQNNHESALELLLTLLQMDRKYGDGAARKTMLDIFNLLGGEGELVARYRSKMFNALH